MTSPLQLAVATFMMFLGSTVLSTVGFGIGMVSMPGLVLGWAVCWSTE